VKTLDSITIFDDYFQPDMLRKQESVKAVSYWKSTQKISSKFQQIGYHT